MRTIDESRLEQTLRGINIPACPAVLGELMGELRKPLTNGKRVAQLIGEDVGLASVVVRSANSPLFGTRRQIASVDEATRLLGFGMLTSLVQEALLRSAVATRDASLERFWDSSRYTASASAQLARIVGGTRPETAYTFGLFRDCGIPLLVQRFPDYKQILRAANQATDRWFTDVEDEALNTNHAVIGYLLARSWGLADTVSQGILMHHDYSIFADPAGLEVESCTLVAINVIAEHVVGTHLRTVQDAEWGKGREPIARFLGYTPTEMDDIADDLLYWLDEQKNQEAA
ncbi:HDOD domain-containing protein [Thauera sp. CAU 1555]|uniref:HDOD domain-containing protein n=1 Tax=Thauera sedimentorum TaxID=2767595 RepID=A0ABR9BHH4_9RHOO|nr:HDOD domain-containing protein [Thauera sedimentorum]MBC9073777.1 HDOD domain-containing protein [Thauera sedimentorum]MBD8504696.1 HDOD domain-containing protein [Thauera sedimentorum]